MRLLLCCCLFIHQVSYGQGRVVINEYMPWPSNGCGVTSEFVELLNFGPGPVDIGCYILTDGDYSVTIPGNTILQPGQYYVIAGQSFIPAPCANINSDVVADLNWNTCGCTSGPIPTTGHGFFTDGGNANEQVVLLDPQLKVVDAVVRSLPAEPSFNIMSAYTLDCDGQIFNLNQMSINYETLGMSTGNGNSFARKLDGDCGWVKDPQQSAGTTNNTSGDFSEVSYVFSYVNSMDCTESHGSVHISVKSNNYGFVFPMKYTLANDTDLDGNFTFSDEYTTATDSIAPDILVDSLAAGRYRLTIESSKGCYLKNFEFQIIPCSNPLAVQLSGFRNTGMNGNRYQLEWSINNMETLEKLVLEKSFDGQQYVPGRTFSFRQGLTGKQDFKVLEDAGPRYFRLKTLSKDGQWRFSPVLSVHETLSLVKTWPNPVKDQLVLELRAALPVSIPYEIYDQNGQRVLRGTLDMNQGPNTLTIATGQLSAGIYQFRASGSQPISFRFVK